MTNTAKYLLAKYIPDLHRMEPRNIGVIVWSAAGVEGRFLAENPDKPGEVDGRSVPAFITSLSAYKQWIKYWKTSLEGEAYNPADGSQPIAVSAPEFLEALKASSKGNFVL